MRRGGGLPILLLRTKYVGWLGLRAILDGQVQARVVGDFDRRGDAMRAACRSRPFVLFAPADGAGIEPCELTQELRKLSPNSKIVFLSEDVDVPILCILEATGIDGYLLWSDVTAEAIEASLAALKAGLHVESPAAVRELAHKSQNEGDKAAAVSLTPRELAVLSGLARGLGRKQIAKQQGLSLRTVYRAIACMETKLDVGASGALIAQAAALGLDSQATCRDVPESWQ